MHKLIFSLFIIALISIVVYAEPTRPSYYNLRDLPSVTIESLGGVGDGITDCSSMLSAAFARGSSVLLGPGTYYCASPVVLGTNCQIIGSGNRISQVKGAPGQAVFKVPSGSAEHIVMRDFRIREGAYGISSTEGGTLSSCQLENIEFYLQEAAGIYFNATGSYFIANDLIGCSFINCHAGISLLSGESNLIFEQLSSTSVELRSNFGTSLAASQFSIIGCRFEAGSASAIITNNGFANLNISQNYFEDKGSPHCSIYVVGASGKGLNYSWNYHSLNNPNPNTITLDLGTGINNSMITGNTLATSTLDGEFCTGITWFGNTLAAGQFLVRADSRCFLYNDIGSPINHLIELGEGYPFQVSNSSVQWINGSGIITADTTASNSWRVYPSSASNTGLLIDSDGYPESPGYGYGLSLRSPNGTRYILKVTDGGIATTSPRP